MTAPKFIPMRMVFRAVEVITFADDENAIADKIAAALPGSFVRVYEYETEGTSIVRRDELRVIRPTETS